MGGGSLPLSVYRLRKRRVFFVVFATQRSVTAVRPLLTLRACLLESAAFIFGDTPLPPLHLRKRRVFFVVFASQRSVTADRPLLPLRACLLESAAFFFGDTQR